MRRLSLLLALLAFPVLADVKSTPNTLTPKEIADGWILLFDGETTFGWKVEGAAEVKDGRLVLGGDVRSVVTFTTPFSEFDFRYQAAAAGGKGRFGLKTGKSAFAIGINPRATAATGTVRLGKGVFPTDKVSVAPDGVVIHAIDVVTDGTSAVQFSTEPGQKLLLHSIAVRPKTDTSLFGGKDLSGWKVYPGTKDKKVASKYTVTKEGWLNVKDGPGDIQTEGQWADFIVQFDCISNGKHLNSGLFFRAIPDLYQQGYEAQIRNEWMGDDRTKPVDFGTGAIYKRQPARKVVSTDGEWFTMTVAAHDRHIATWVNGYPVVSWTDDRKESDNARQGFKKGKGALSIQGHDPTTDLSFRNFRIQSLDPK